jgi:uncharacterized protein (DUF2336 family)
VGIAPYLRITPCFFEFISKFNQIITKIVRLYLCIVKNEAAKINFAPKARITMLGGDSDKIVTDQKTVQKRFGGLQADYLYELARSKNPDDRRQLGNAVTDLFTDGNLSLREQDIVSDILISMLKQAERDLRRSIADRLAGLDQAPLRVVLYLSNDEIDVARKILAQSPVLEEMDLMLIIETQKSPYWQAIAERKDLQAGVVRALVETRDPSTAKTLVNNQDVTIPMDAFRVLSEMAKAANDLCAPLLHRSDLPQELVASIYAIAGEKIRSEMDESMPDERRDSAAPHVADTVQEFVNAAKNEYDPTELMIDAARSLREKGRLSIDGMVQSLKNGQVASFIAQMMVFLQTDLSQVKKMISEENGQTMAAVCRVNRVDKKIFLKMFLLTQKYRTGERIVDPMVLNTALTEFDQLTIDACRRRVSAMKRI